MPSLNLALDYFEHPKTRRLVALLGPGSDVLPLRLWTYCAKYHRDDGLLASYTPEIVEEAIGWRGTPGAAVKALVECGQYVGKKGFLEPVEGGFQVHDWEEYEGHFSKYHEAAKAGAKARWGKRLQKIEKKKVCEPHSEPQCEPQCGVDANRNAPAGQGRVVQRGSRTPSPHVRIFEEEGAKAGVKVVILKPDAIQLAEALHLCESEDTYRSACSRYFALDDKFISDSGYQGRWLVSRLQKVLSGPKRPVSVIDPAENERRMKLALATGGPR